MRTLLVIALACLAAACTEPRSAACKEVCKREAECIDSVALDAVGNKLPFDEKECIAACSALEHDVEHSAAKVQRHIECVTKQTACPAVLECK
ncbi:MAG TPA: hypothetical protein VGC42_32435 [Kofleriaceae bacterium]